MHAGKSFSDIEIISAIETGAEVDNAIGFIYRNYYNMLEKFVVTNSGHQADAEDAIQEAIIAFVDIIRKGKFRGDTNVKSFLYTLTRNLWISELRRRSSSEKRNLNFENAKETKETVEHDITVYLAYRENQKVVIALFDQLGDRCRQILTLFYYDNLSINEILQHTDYESEQVLRNKKYKCLKELITKVKQSPVVSNNLKNALRYAK